MPTISGNGKISCFDFENMMYGKPTPAGKRRGQFLFDELYKVRPDLTRHVDFQDIDPFYNDNNQSVFWNWLRENW